MTMDNDSDRVLAWCRARTGPPVGMRTTPDVVCVVARLGAGSIYVGRYGVPDEPRRLDPDVVVASGSTWSEVARKLGL